jgi:hypothetical protein
MLGSFCRPGENLGKIAGICMSPQGAVPAIRPAPGKIITRWEKFAVFNVAADVRRL